MVDFLVQNSLMKPTMLCYWEKLFLETGMRKKIDYGGPVETFPLF